MIVFLIAIANSSRTKMQTDIKSVLNLSSYPTASDPSGHCMDFCQEYPQVIPSEIKKSNIIVFYAWQSISLDNYFKNLIFYKNEIKITVHIFKSKAIAFQCWLGYNS